MLLVCKRIKKNFFPTINPVELFDLKECTYIDVIKIKLKWEEASSA